MMGPLGEQILVSIFSRIPQNDIKLKCSIIRAFALANIKSPSIDFVIEVLLKTAKYLLKQKLNHFYMQGLTIKLS